MVIRRYLAIGAAALTVGLAVFLRAGGTALAVLLGLCLALGLIKALRPLWRPLLCGLLAAALMGGLYAWRYTAAEQLTGCELPFTGTVLEVSPYTAHRSTIYARVGGQHRVIDLTAYLPEEETPLAGERIAGTLTITGAAAAAAPPNHRTTKCIWRGRKRRFGHRYADSRYRRPAGWAAHRPF